jgi:broad-specificity NMP kinase
MELLQQVAPKLLKDVIGNKMQIKSLLEILKDNKYMPKIIILMGPTGCGKTLICNLIFKELNFKVYDISTKETLQNLEKYITYRSIDCFDKNKVKKIIFLDNIEILINTEKNVFSIIENSLPLLIKNNIFLIITTKVSEEKIIVNSLKKNIEIIKLTQPSIKDTFVYLSNVLPDYDEENLLNIVKKQRGNIRDIVLNLKNSDNELTEIVKYRGYSEYTNFEIIDSFMLKSTWQDIDAILNSDPCMVSYLLYENVLDEIYTNRDATSIMKSYYQINNAYVIANQIEKYMQDALDWSVYKTVQILKLGSIYVTLNNLKKKKERKNVSFRFSQVLSKLSHRNIMAKKFNLSNLPILDLIHLIDQKSISSTDEIKQINSTYHKYFT